mmetsp:Transcript_12753/g.40218  ORF Transcript_12753/g.40218 Transcript_12753/m.40218 type:complete len:208 (-) Transcript_12753:446-1069(-)
MWSWAGTQVGADLKRALQQSEEAAVQEENDMLQAALLRSKTDFQSPHGSEEHTFFRLTRVSVPILQTLRSSPYLATRREQVEARHCDVAPGFTQGTLLVPITEERYRELGLDLQPYHVMAYPSDREAILEALRAVPAAKRPKLRVDDRANGRGAAEEAPTDSHGEGEDEADEPASLVEERFVDGSMVPVRHGFIHFVDDGDVHYFVG